MRNPLLPSIPLWAAKAAQTQATRTTDDGIRDARVVGNSTDAVRDVGGASVRVRMEGPTLLDGGYLFAIRPAQVHRTAGGSAGQLHTWLPAISGVPGSKYGASRERLAELMVLPILQLLFMSLQCRL